MDVGAGFRTNICWRGVRVQWQSRMVCVVDEAAGCARVRSRVGEGGVGRCRRHMQGGSSLNVAGGLAGANKKNGEKITIFFVCGSES